MKAVVNGTRGIDVVVKSEYVDVDLIVLLAFVVVGGGGGSTIAVSQRAGTRTGRDSWLGLELSQLVVREKWRMRGPFGVQGSVVLQAAVRRITLPSVHGTKKSGQGVFCSMNPGRRRVEKWQIGAQTRVVLNRWKTVRV